MSTEVSGSGSPTKNPESKVNSSVQPKVATKENDNKATTAVPHHEETVDHHDEIVKQIFGDVGELVSDFSCAVESTVLLHGRMYITDKFICFYSNLFGMEKKIRIPYSHITLITKEKTALVIPNAIAITTYRKEYIFRSFWDRDECFEMLKSFIKKYKGITNSSSSKSTAHSSNTTASTGNSDSNAVANTSHNSQDGENDDSKAVNAPVKKRSSTNASASTVEDNEVEQDDTSTNDDHDIASFDEECKASRLKIVVLGGETIHVPLDVFLTKLVDDQASYSLKAHHEKNGDLNIETSSWSPALDYSAVSNSISTRDMKFMKVCNLPGLKQTRGIKIQKIKRFGSNGAIIQTSTRLDDVPMGDAFSVDDCVILRSVNDGESVVVEVYLEVKYLKYTLLKSVIESSTHPEVTKWLQDYVAAWKQHLSPKPIRDSSADDDTPVSPEVLAADVKLYAEQYKEYKLKNLAFTNRVLNISLKQYAHHFIADDAPFSIIKYHEQCQDNSMVLSEWEKEPSAVEPNSHSTRSLKFMKVCNLPGLKETRATKSQKWRKCGSVGYVVYTSTKLDDVPFADTFLVDDVVFIKAVDKHHVALEAYMEVKFVKSTMMKGFIESSTNKEVVKWLQDYGTALQKYASTIPGASPVSVEHVLPGADEQSKPFDVTHPIDAFFESFGFYGGRYIFVMFCILFFVFLFFGFQWRATNLRIYELNAKMDLLLEEMNKLKSKAYH